MFMYICIYLYIELFIYSNLLTSLDWLPSLSQCLSQSLPFAKPFAKPFAEPGYGAYGTAPPWPCFAEVFRKVLGKALRKARQPIHK